MFEEILHTLEMGYSHENLLYACSIFHHYLGTLRYLQQYREATQQDSNATDIVTETIHYMKENIGRKLTLKEIAQHTGYSVPYFSSLFNQRTGYAPLMYFNMLKIQQACALLDFTEIKINQVCYKVGIEDPYYFSRYSTRLWECPPKNTKNSRKDKHVPLTASQKRKI